MEIKCCENVKLPDGLKESIDFLAVVSDKCRLHILHLLKQDKELCVCEIWKALNSPQNLISHHLKVLKDFDLISSRKDGLKVFYKLNKSNLKKHSKLLNKFV
jgi:ArsR family transcriptional regulator